MSRFKWAPWVFSLALLSACSGTQYDPTTSAGQQAIIDGVNQSLSQSPPDCATAISIAQNGIDSASSNDGLRMAAASAYACDANLDFVDFVNNLVNDKGSLVGPGLWPKLASYFPSSPTPGADQVVEGAEFASDLLQSVLSPGALVSSANQLTDSKFAQYNPGSALASDRTIDANFYLVLTSMAAIGGLENRYASTTSPTFELGTSSTLASWDGADASAVDANGCSYASSIVNFADATGGVATQLTGSGGDTVQKLQGLYQTVIYAFCDAGCQNMDAATFISKYPIVAAGSGITVGAWKPSGAGCTTTCASCPTTLRDPGSCKQLATDPNSCAAAGIMNMIVNSPNFGWSTSCIKADGTIGTVGGGGSCS